MTRLGRPSIWLPLAMLVLTGLGGSLLTRQSCVALSERDRGSYGLRPVRQAYFDALSASCGAGLLTYDLNRDYTPLGRAVLAGLGVAGALMYLAAARQAVGRLWATAGQRLPSIGFILAAFVVLQTLVIPVVWLGGRVTGSSSPLGDDAFNAIAAFSSLGWLRGNSTPGQEAIYAGVALLAALGWPVWLLIVPSYRRQGTRIKGTLVSVISYVAFLLACAGVVTALEVPRGLPHGPAAAGAASDERLAAQRADVRFAHSFVQVVCASAAGTSTEKLSDRGVSDGTKLILAGVLLVGGLGGSTGGGVRWTLLLWALTVAGAVVGSAPGRSRDELTRRCALAGTAVLGAVLTLALVVAFGLLIIEAWIGSPFQTPPTFADALLDATSAVAGGNLSSGLTSTLTSFNLSRGIRQNVDLYQYGMTWLAAAMLIGRVLPVLVLGRVAQVRFNDAPPAMVPLN